MKAPAPSLLRAQRLPLRCALALSVLALLAGCTGGWGGLVVVAPAIVTQPISLTVTAGQSATFTVVATGTAPLAYQWYNGATAISGANSATYTIPATVASSTGSVFTVTVANSAGSVTSAKATLTVNTVPVATSLVCGSATPPYNATTTLVPTFSGGTATIGSTGAGSSDIAASAVSGSSYTTPALTASKTYTLTVTGTAGNTATTACSVTPTAVAITPISPANQTFAPGTIAFSATASGGATDKLNWTANSGTFTANVWTTPSAAGTYTIAATSADNPAVSVSTTAILSAPVIVTQPTSATLCPNGTVTLSVTASYATAYQWKFNSVAIQGATSSSYVIANAGTGNAGSYTVTVSNPIGSVTSSPANISVGASFTSNPVSLSIYTSQTATFSVSVAGTPPFSYQWYVIAPGSSTGTAISGATASTYTTAPVTTANSGSQYYAKVSDACESPITSSSATLTVTSGNVPPTITLQPVGIAVAAGSTSATFTVTASGTPSLSYQWYRVPSGGAGGTAVSGATSPSYTLPATSTAATNDQDQYYCIVSNSYGQAVSVHATLAVGAGILIQIGNQPKTLYVNAGANATYSVTATSTASLSYQWYVAAPGSSTFTPIAGATNPTYTFTSTTVSQTGSVVYVTVSNGSTASVNSTTAGLWVGALGQISSLCSSVWSPLGNAVSLGGTGTNCSFQLVAASGGQHGEIVWPNLISTGNIQLSFTVTISNPSSPPADGFAMVLGDPSLGATPTSLGQTGQGLGAEDIPGFVLGFDTYENPGDPPIPYLGVGRGEDALWENPWVNVNTNIPPLAVVGSVQAHAYVITIVQGQMTVSMDGLQVFSGSVSVPPVAYLYVTASTGLYYELTVIGNLAATISVPTN